MMKIDFQKCGGLVPAIIQDAQTKVVLMLGYMNEEALQKTQESGLVTFYSRSRQCLWTKGETSGNYLHLVDIKVDCDNDTLLILANPDGPTCHKGTDTCWGEENKPNPLLFLSELNDFIEKEKNLRKLTIEEIQQTVAKKYSVEVSQILSEERTQTLVTPRQLAMYIARKFSMKGLKEIAQQFRKTHSTVIHGVKNIEKMLDVDDELKSNLEEILAEFGYRLSDKY